VLRVQGISVGIAADDPELAAATPFAVRAFAVIAAVVVAVVEDST
jgi:hypothetical protein